jgi:hypothetical protein
VAGEADKPQWKTNGPLQKAGPTKAKTCLLVGPLLCNRCGTGGVFEILIDVREIALSDEFLGQKIRDVPNFAIESRVIRARAGENDDAGKRAFRPAHVAIPEANGDLLGTARRFFEPVGKWAVGKQKMKVLAIGTRNHGQSFGETAQEHLLPKECAVRAKI